MIRATCAVLLMIGLAACTSVQVKPLDPAKPAGVPFYLTKPMVKKTITTYSFFQTANLGAAAFHTASTVETEVVDVTDTSAGYTVNHWRSFVGESKFSTEMNESSGLSKLSVEDKEGVTEFLKGIAEGAKTLSEAAKTLKTPPTGAPAGISDAESQYFQILFAQGILVTKQVTVTYEALP